MESNAAGQYHSWQPRPFDENDPGAPPPSPEEDAQRNFVAIAQARQQDEDPAAALEGRARPTPGADTDFASLKFQRETTLLTNADEYAASIRREAELYVKQIRTEVETLNTEAERRYEEAEAVKARAE